MQIGKGARIQDYIESLISLHERFVARVRTLHEMEGVTWSNAWIDEYWPNPTLDENPDRPYPENHVAWALKFDTATLHGSRFDDSRRSWEGAIWRIRYHETFPPSASLLLRVIAACVTSNPFMLGTSGYFHARPGYSANEPGYHVWNENPLWSGEYSPRRRFVHPETREPFSNDAWTRVPTLEALIGRAFPGIALAPNIAALPTHEVTSALVRREDARLLNWLHRALDMFYLVKIPKGARRCALPGSFQNFDLAYQPTSTFRQYEPNITLWDDPEVPIRGFEWPWYHPVPEGGVLKTTNEPAPVQVEQRANRTWHYDAVADPWRSLVSGGELLNSGDPSRGWYYRFEGFWKGDYYGGIQRRIMPPPFDRRHASWREYAKGEAIAWWGFTGPHYNYRRYAEVEQSWYKSTLAEMDTWEDVEDIAEYWEWDAFMYHDYHGQSGITFVFETSAETYRFTLMPGEAVSETLRFTAHEVHMFIEGSPPAVSPYFGDATWIPSDRTKSLGYFYGSHVSVSQHPLPDMFRDIRPLIGEASPEA